VLQKAHPGSDFNYFRNFAMFRRSSIQPIAVAAVVAAQLLTLGGMLAAEPSRVAWSPTREDAVVIEGVPSNMLPADGAISKSLMSQRPSSLSRPIPGRTRTHFTHAPTAPEQLPTISGAPRSPHGLPVPQETYYDEGGQIFEGDMISGNMMPGDPCCGGCGTPGCNLCGRGGCTWVPLCLALPLPPIDGLEVYGGVQGFTGPANRGGSGSFGFHEGFNWGVPCCCCVMAAQLGATWTQNNFDGNYLTSNQRDQTFLTAGLNRRADFGLQGGFVVDYFHEEWDYTADLAQVRAELSWLWCDCNEFGAWCAVGVNNANNLFIREPDANSNTITFRGQQATLEVNDMFAFFFRRKFECGGQGRLFGGFTRNSQGLVGGDAQFPMNPNWSLRTNFIYVAPGGDSTSDPSYTRESWNVGFSVVWTPCGRSKCGQDYCRPLFNVADNGTFLTRLVR
jgi:hypothetical protein